MRVRLAFAVAAHLEPDILVVDEVLAVGDAEFQKKAIGKMKDISGNDGRTVLFVSHNMAAVKSLCTRGIVLENGTSVFEGSAEECVGYYLGGEKNFKNKKVFKPHEIANNFFELHEILMHKAGQPQKEFLDENDEIEIVTSVTFFEKTERLHLTYLLSNEEGDSLFTFSHNKSFSLNEGLNTLTCKFPKSFLNIGSYFLSLYIIKDKKTTAYVEKDIINFQIIHGERSIGSWTGKEPGFIKPQFHWQNK
jgi:lipopolysaccharide transport system ATP-binding protein